MSLSTDTQSPPMLDRVVRGRKAWRRGTLNRDDWFISIPEACLKEIAAVIDQLREQVQNLE